MIRCHLHSILQGLRNPGLLIACGLFSLVIQSSCSQPAGPHGPDSTRVSDTTHKDTTGHKDSTVHTDTTIHHDSTVRQDTSYRGILYPSLGDSVYYGVALSGDGSVAAITGFKGVERLVYVFNANTGKVTRRLVVDRSVSDLQLDYTGRHLLALGMEDMFLYNTAGGDLVHTFQGGGWLTSSGDSILVYTRTNDGTFATLAFVSADGQVIRQFTPESDWHPQFLSRDARILTMWTHPGNLYRFDTRTGARTTDPEIRAGFYDLHESPDDNLIVGFHNDQSNLFMAYDALTGQQVPTYPFSDIRSFQIAGDNRTMAVSFQNGQSSREAIVDIRTGTTIRELPPAPSAYAGVSQFRFSDDGKRLVGGYYNALRVWDIK